MRGFKVTLCLSGMVSVILMASMFASAQDRVPVSVVMPQERALSQQLQLSGSLTAKHNANLSSRTAGLVAELLVDAGAVVTQGQPLLKLDTALASHQLAQQSAALNAAKVLQAERQRLVVEAEQLTAQQLFPKTELALRQAALAEAEAIYQQAQANLQQQQEVVSRHTLTAPFSGVIATRSTDVGEWVALGAPVMQLVSLTPLLLDVQVPQEYYGALSSLRRIDVQADILPEQKLSARLLATVPVGDSSSRSFLARLEVTDEQQALLPGTSASATFYFERAQTNVLVVPPDALLRHPDGNFSLFAIRDDKAYRHNVTIGRSTEQGVEILTGLPRQQAVVVRGNETLRDGQTVNIVGRNSSLGD
ncbi:MexH family multidrug efflux RND transporter periplasmic adaptor subunit [Alishewanella longhuensis]|uniref:MexH family multidrug efflux RND transporter periplasmic adaptor subunit n=1 Tax=Alishewanella longhuensis TaxID=1091037 RepID=A0ABQ3KW48_9ALTE|nr:efflux RND transporter periplasmic adaptor subunit [Alishewanella longhuensis]GHG61309.1 MexH family multidrug efflux RND transporter periplasmic adaptor subunit [Alishewanella longhuensis]